MKTPSAIFFFSLLFLVSLLSCRQDPEIIEIPVPYAIDSLALLPQWENHPSFFGENKKQWIGWADDSLCLLLGNGRFSSLTLDGSILSDWNTSLSATKHTNEAYLPSISRHWTVTQDHNQGVLRIGNSLVENTRTFFNLGNQEQTRALSFYSGLEWQPKGDAGALLKTTPTEFSWVGWARDTSDQVGLVYVAGYLNSLPGNPIVDRVEWHPLPASTQPSAVPAFLTKVGESVLVGIGNSSDSTSNFGEMMLMWHPNQGYERIPADRYGPAGLRTAFSALDGKTAYLIVGGGDFFEVEPDGTLSPRYIGIYTEGISHLSSARDLPGYFAFFFNQELILLDKNTLTLWRAASLGLDGHNINDVTLFKDTLLISSRTGGIFYQALSDVWPEEQR